MSDPAHDCSAWSARLDALRGRGAERTDPIRFHHLQTLLGRLGDQREPVRRLLEARLRAGLEALDAGLPAPPLDPRAPRAARAAKPVAAAMATPLAQLGRALQAHPPAAGAGGPGPICMRPELASVERFRRTWSDQRALEQVQHAAMRSPANAGPLNSHALVLQSLALMQELSPAYLARFMAQVESLQWLERLPLPAAPATRGTKGSKPAQRNRTKA